MTSHKRLFLSFIPGLLFLLGWELIVGHNARLQFLFASPSLIASVGMEELSKASFYYDVGLTTLEAFAGLCIGVVTGTVCGLLLWSNRKLNFLARPYLILVGSIPIFTIAPVMIMWFGIGFLSKVVMSGFAVFFVALIQAYDGAQVAARDYESLAIRLKASRFQTIRKIIVPGALEWVFTGLKVNIGVALTGAFIAEFVSSEAGLGYYILRTSSLYDMPRAFFGLFVFCLIALILTYGGEILRQQIRKSL
jgi:NitT/TauT family transport system permease protein